MVFKAYMHMMREDTYHTQIWILIRTHIRLNYKCTPAQGTAQEREETRGEGPQQAEEK